jgi:uncharacterized membrane protein
MTDQTTTDADSASSVPTSMPEAVPGPGDFGVEVATHPTRRGWLSHWDRHPGVRSGDDLTFGERAADKMRNSMGSWAFVGSALLFLALWMLFNSLAVKNQGFDPYPYILLNLTLSCLAAMQGAILLIAAKRSDQISSELANHDYETDKQAAARIELVHERLAEMAAHNHDLLEQNNALLKQLVATQPAQG